jgi:stearoyl-CoA desaturase (Delta-9 desaturase)
MHNNPALNLPIDEALHATQDAIDATLDSAQRTLEAGKQSLVEGAQHIGQRLEEGKQQLSNKIEQSAEALADFKVSAAQQVSERLRETGKQLDGIKETAVQKMDGIKESAAQTMDGIKESAAHKMDVIKGSAAHAQAALRQTIEALPSLPTLPKPKANIFKRASKRVAQWFDTQRTYEVAADQGKQIDWIRTLPFIGVHLMCFAVIWVGVSPVALIACLAMYVVRMFAITGFYHRYFSHKTYKTSRVFQFIMALWGAACVQRGALWWASHHRNHHRFSDTAQDKHSPRQHGFFHSHMGWIMSKGSYRVDYSNIKDLTKFPELVWLDRYDLLVPIALGHVMFALGWVLNYFYPELGTSATQMLVWGFFISTVLLFHGTVTINSLSHVFGKQRFKTNDDSRNNWFLALITLGEGWHNNHHFFAGSTRQGFYWWEVDLTYYTLKLFSKLGLVWDLKPVPAAILAHGRRADRAKKHASNDA